LEVALGALRTRLEPGDIEGEDLIDALEAEVSNLARDAATALRHWPEGAGREEGRTAPRSSAVVPPRSRRSMVEEVDRDFGPSPDGVHPSLMMRVERMMQDDWAAGRERELERERRPRSRAVKNARKPKEKPKVWHTQVARDVLAPSVVKQMMALELRKGVLVAQ